MSEEVTVTMDVEEAPVEEESRDEVSQGSQKDQESSQEQQSEVTTEDSQTTQAETPKSEGEVSQESTQELQEPPTPPKPKVTIYLKTPKEKQSIEIDEDSEVKDIKTIAAEKFSADPEYLCLIFAGKLMEDSETLETHNIKDGMTIHLIIKTAPRQPEPGPQRPPADIAQTPYGLGAVGGLVGLESLGMGSANFMELQNRLQTELLGNPELLKRVLENPLVQSLMGDFDSMKVLIANNPQMQDLMSRHPEIRNMLNNPELLKNTTELARNPSMLQELMRNLDGSSPIESSVSSFTSLPAVYASFQPSATQVADKVQQAQQRTDSSFIFNNPQMSSLLQQMSENPQLVQNMLSAPYTQSMLQALAADPSMAAAIVNENPLYQGNPALQSYITSMMPQLINQLQNPDIQNMMANPQAINALLHIQEGMDQLRNVAPGLVGNLGLGSFNDYSGNENPDSPNSNQNETSPLPTDSFSQFMSRMVSQMSQNNPSLPPEERFKVQMEYMKAMGFTNEEKNLQMLTATFGDINAAVQKILSRGGYNF